MPKAPVPYVNRDEMPDPEERDGLLFCMVPECPLAAATKGCLRYWYKMHVNLHTGEKPWPCLHCDKVFPDFSQRSQHKKKAHPKVPTDERGRHIEALNKERIARGEEARPLTGHRRKGKAPGQPPKAAPASGAGTEAEGGFIPYDPAVAACDLPNGKAPRRRRKAAPASGAMATSSPTPSTIPSAPLEQSTASSSSSAPPPFPAFDAAQALAQVAHFYPSAAVQASRDAQAAQASTSHNAVGYPGPSSTPQQDYALWPGNSAVAQQYPSAQVSTAGPGPATSFTGGSNGALPKGQAPRRRRKAAPASGAWAEAQDGFVQYQPPVAPFPAVVEQPTQLPCIPPPGRALDQTPYSAPFGIPAQVQEFMHPIAPQSYLDAPRADGYAQSDYAFLNNGFLPHHAGGPAFYLGDQAALATEGAGPSQPSAVSMSRAWSSSSGQSTSSTSSAPRVRASHRRQQSAPGLPTQSLRRTAIHRRTRSARAEPYYHPPRNAPVSPPPMASFAQDAFNFPPISNAAFAPFHASDAGTPSLSGGSTMSSPASRMGTMSPSMSASEYTLVDPVASHQNLASGSLFAHPDEGHYHTLPQGWTPFDEEIFCAAQRQLGSQFGWEGLGE